MSARLVEVLESRWLDPEPLVVISQSVNPSVQQAIEGYRNALRGLRESVALAEQSEARFDSHAKARKSLMADLVTQDKGAGYIFAQVQAQATKPMPESFAKEVADLYAGLAAKRQVELRETLAAHREAIAEHFDRELEANRRPESQEPIRAALEQFEAIVGP